MKHIKLFESFDQNFDKGPYSSLSVVKDAIEAAGITVLGVDNYESGKRDRRDEASDYEDFDLIVKFKGGAEEPINLGIDPAGRVTWSDFSHTTLMGDTNAPETITKKFKEAWSLEPGDSDELKKFFHDNDPKNGAKIDYGEPYDQRADKWKTNESAASDITVKFKEWTCKMNFAQYKNDRTAIELVDSSNGEPIAMATVNIPEEDIEDDEVIIKNYSENDGMLDALMDAGVVGEPLRMVKSGFVEVPVVKLLIKE